MLNVSESNLIVKYLIIGSGPSGIAVANFLISKGVRPVIVDGGVKVTKVAAPQNRDSGKNKTWFGSEMSYFQPYVSQIEYSESVDVRASFSPGGFSRVWGATFAINEKFSDWPVEMTPSEQDISSVKMLVPHQETSWDESLDKNALRGSKQSFEFLSEVRKKLRDKNSYTIQPSTIAIDTNPKSFNCCTACRGCLVGCTSNSIWFAGDVLEKWNTLGLIDYRPGFLVERVEECEKVTIYGCDSYKNESQIVAEKVFLAVGPISTASIVIRSGLQKEVIIRDTATAFGAAIQLRSSNRNSQDGYHSLSQWWISSPEMFAQIYPPTDDLTELIMKRFRLLKIFRRILRLFVLRIHPVIMYLPVNQSRHLRVHSREGTIVIDEDGDKMLVQKSFKNQIQILARLFIRSGYVMHQKMFRYKSAGGGYHFGSSFPQGTSSDHVGRPRFFKNVHIVDSSVLPLLPLGSITPTIMVNAVRIARTVLQEEVH